MSDKLKDIESVITKLSAEELKTVKAFIFYLMHKEWANN